MHQKLTTFLSSPYFQPLVWSLALFLLYRMDVGGTTLCLFRFVGMDHCPGCGIGHSIHYTLHLQWSKAAEEHLLGIPATLVLIYMILKPFLTHIKFRYEFKSNAHDASRHSAGRVAVSSKPYPGIE